MRQAFKFFTSFCAGSLLLLLPLSVSAQVEDRPIYRRESRSVSNQGDQGPGQGE